jgi:hypothetical protein
MKIKKSNMSYFAPYVKPVFSRCQHGNRLHAS